jgi:hypothetical protein
VTKGGRELAEPLPRPISVMTSRIVASFLIGVAALAAVACTPSSPAGISRPASGADPRPSSADPRLCLARPGWPRLTLTDTSPVPVSTVQAGSRIVITVPRPTPGEGRATPVYVAKSGLLREVCSVVLRDHGRRTIFAARRAGRTYLSATVELHLAWSPSPSRPAPDVAMPAWGGTVIVRAG